MKTCLPPKVLGMDVQLVKRSFTRPDKLKRHRETHINEKKYQCSKCNKSFHRKSDLKLHDDRLPSGNQSKELQLNEGKVFLSFRSH